MAIKREYLRLSGERPRNFHGTIKVPPSKSYLHRALFVASLRGSSSRILGCGKNYSEDIEVYNKSSDVSWRWDKKESTFRINLVGTAPKFETR